MATLKEDIEVKFEYVFIDDELFVIGVSTPFTKPPNANLPISVPVVLVAAETQKASVADNKLGFTIVSNPTGFPEISITVYKATESKVT